MPPLPTLTQLVIGLFVLMALLFAPSASLADGCKLRKPCRRLPICECPKENLHFRMEMDITGGIVNATYRRIVVATSESLRSDDISKLRVDVEHTRAAGVEVIAVDDKLATTLYRKTEEFALGYVSPVDVDEWAGGDAPVLTVNAELGQKKLLVKIPVLGFEFFGKKASSRAERVRVQIMNNEPLDGFTKFCLDNWEKLADFTDIYFLARRGGEIRRGKDLEWNYPPIIELFPAKPPAK